MKVRIFVRLSEPRKEIWIESYTVRHSETSLVRKQEREDSFPVCVVR